jgi:hypothetical protein
MSLMASETVSMDRLAALHSQCLSFAKNGSMAFKSGEYFGKNSSRAPVARIA